MSVVWPASLTGARVGLTDEQVPAVIRTEMDVGPAKVRRRATVEQRFVSWPLEFTGAERAIFDTFRANLAATGEVFEAEDPRSDETVEYRVVAWPRWSMWAAGPPELRRWRGTLELEILPS